MLVPCRSLFMGEADRLPLEAELDLTQVELFGNHPFRRPVRVTGAIVNRAGVVTLEARAQFLFEGRCDRCLTEFTREYDIPVEHILVTALENEDSDFVLLQDYQLPLDELVRDDILLELPYKSLCREDCRGLCPQCGRNLNDGLCGCSTKTEDPCLAILKQLLN